MTNPLVPPAPDLEPAIGGRVGQLREAIPLLQTVLYALGCIACVLLVWFILTRGEKNEERIVSGVKLPSPAETFGKFRSLWFDSALTRNTWASVRRVSLGFLLASMVGIPLGVLCGCFPRVAAFMAPLTLFGRNIPMAALIPLTLLVFGIEEYQKVMFIFLAAVAFIVSDSAQAIRDIGQAYIDTAYTLGARRYQVVLKVLVPLALPDIFNSLRLLFGLAFGYIMLAEVIQSGGEAGLGGIINTLQRRSQLEQIYLILFIIPLVALGIDRLLYLVQKQLFPHRYGGDGLLAIAVKQTLYGCEALIRKIFPGSGAIGARGPVPSGAKPAPPAADSPAPPAADSKESSA